MIFQNASAFLLALAAIPIVLFYVLKIRLRRAPVSTTMFWDRIFDEKKPRSIWQRLRHLLSLLLQLLFLSFLLFAVVDPLFDHEARDARRIVVVLDNSASMNVFADGRSAEKSSQETRLDVAREKVREFVRGLRRHDEVAIVTAGTQARVRSGFTHHPQLLERTLDAVEPTDGPTDLLAGIALARRLSTPRDADDNDSTSDAKDTEDADGRIIVVTDGGVDLATIPDAASLSSDALEWVVVGAPVANCGITQFQVRRSAIDATGYEILVEVTCFAPAPIETRLELTLDDAPIDVVPITLAPGRPWTKRFERTSTKGGRLDAALTVDDALPTDDRARAILPDVRLQPVTLVGPENLFLDKVFEAMPLLDLRRATNAATRRQAREVVVFHRDVPETLPDGPVLVIDPRNSCAEFTVGDALTEPLIVKQKSDSVVMRHVHLENVYLPGARRLDAPNATALATSLGGDTLLAHRPRRSGDIVVLTGDLDRGDLALRTAFPILVANVLRAFAGGEGEIREATATGEVRAFDLPTQLLAAARASGGSALSGTLVARSPNGGETPLDVDFRRGEITLGPLPTTGIWTVHPKGLDVGDPRTPSLGIACNLASRAESDLSREAPEGSTASITTSGISGRPIWFLLVVLALVLTVVEWGLYQRRRVS